MTAEHRERISAAMRGKVKTEEHRRKLSRSQIRFVERRKLLEELERS